MSTTKDDGGAKSATRPRRTHSQDRPARSEEGGSTATASGARSRLATPRLRVMRKQPSEEVPAAAAPTMTSRAWDADMAGTRVASRLKVVRPESAASSAGLATRSASMSRVPSGLDRALSGSTIDSARPARRAAWPAASSRATSDSGSRAHSVDIFSLAKMRSSSSGGNAPADRKVRGRGDSTSRKERFAGVTAQDQSPSTRKRVSGSTNLQVRREPQDSKLDNAKPNGTLRVEHPSGAQIKVPSTAAEKVREEPVAPRPVVATCMPRPVVATCMPRPSPDDSKRGEASDVQVDDAQPTSKSRRKSSRSSPSSRGSPRAAGDDAAEPRKKRRKSKKKSSLEAERKHAVDADFEQSDRKLDKVRAHRSAEHGSPSAHDRHGAQGIPADYHWGNRHDTKSRDRDQMEQLDRELEEMKASAAERDSRDERASPMRARSRSEHPSSRRYRSPSRSPERGSTAAGGVHHRREREDRSRRTGDPEPESNSDRWEPDGDDGLDTIWSASKERRDERELRRSGSSSNRRARDRRHSSVSPQRSSKRDRRTVNKTNRSSDEGRSRTRSRKRSRSPETEKANKSSKRAGRLSSNERKGGSRMLGLALTSSREQRKTEQRKSSSPMASDTPFSKADEPTPKESPSEPTEREHTAGGRLSASSSEAEHRSTRDDDTVNGGKPSGADAPVAVPTAARTEPPPRAPPEDRREEDQEGQWPSSRGGPRWRRGQFDIVEERNLRVIIPKESDDAPAAKTDIANVEDDRPLCNFFGTSRGCMRGDACWFRHVLPDEANGGKQDPLRQAEQLDREVEGFAGSRGDGATTISGKQASPSPSPTGSPRWTDYSDWQSYGYYGADASGIVGSMVLDAISSSDEESQPDGELCASAGVPTRVHKLASSTPCTKRDNSKDATATKLT
jgi:hypothetical protein